MAEQKFIVWGASEQATAPMVLYVGLLPIISGRSDLGRNSVGSTYRGLWRERTALRALILCTRCTEIPACIYFRRAYSRTRHLFDTTLAPSELQVVTLTHADLAVVRPPTGSYAPPCGGAPGWT